MKNPHKGFAATATLVLVLGLLVIAGIGYTVLKPQVLKAPEGTATGEDHGAQTAPGDHSEEDHDATDGVQADTRTSIAWRFTNAGEVQGIPYTNVTVTVNGRAYDMGKFTGSCSELGANGGVDGKGLLAGELEAVQCWYAGGGNEIGVFAHEDGGYDLMVGELSEGDEGSGLFRGNFKVKNIILP